MNNRSWLLLLACLSLGIPSAYAQKQSHRPLPDEPDMKAGPEMMADRLKELRELHEIQDRVQDLLKDPDFQKNLTTRFSPEELQKLREKILTGDGLGRDASWNKLLDQAVSRHKLDERQIDILRRWAERSDNARSAMPIEHGVQTGRTSSGSSAASSGLSLPGSDASGMSAEPSFWNRLQGDTSDWLAKHLDGFAGDVFDAMNELGATEEGAPLAELMRSLNRTDLPGGNLADEAAGMSNYLPDLSGSLPDTGGFWSEFGSIFREMSGPSLPSLGGAVSTPRLPGASTGDGESWGGMIALVSLGVLLVLLWKMGSLARFRTALGAGDAWRLGPWPVAPAAVATRSDLVRAFEYLALLRLGPDAGTHHHRELAERLARQGHDEPARRQAAEQLAWLYEQARYAPANESLSADEYIEARHALCFLAGVTAA
jgi:hypothetical protein